MSTDSAASAAPRRTTRWLAAGLALATIVAYQGVFDCAFVNFDDDHYVYQNRVIQGGLSWSFLKWAFTTIEFYNWHPLTWISLELDYELFGLNPKGYHATSLALHVVNSILLLSMLARITGNVFRSACVAGFFALHPLHVESVAWISERKDVLSAFFWLATMALYAHYCSRPGWLRYAATLAAFALGLMAKPMLVTLPFVLLLVDYWPVKRIGGLVAANKNQPKTEPQAQAPRCSLAWSLVEKMPFLLLSGGSCVITYLAQEWSGGIQEGGRYGLEARLLNVPLNYAAYLRRTFWPANLAVIYPYPRESPPIWQVAAAMTLLVVLTLVALSLLKRLPYLFVGWFWFLGTLVPVIGVVQVGLQATADRYTYIPMIGLLLAVCWGVGDLAVRMRWSRPLVTAVASLLLAGCAAATSLQVGYWRDGLALWSRAVRVSPRSPTALSHLAVALAERGSTEEAERCLRTCLLIDPDTRDAHLNLGFILLQSGRKEEAIGHLRSALGDKPDPENLGLLAELEGDSNRAIALYRQAIEQNPNNAGAHELLGAALLKQGNQEEGQQHLDEAERLKPLWQSSQPGSFLQTP
ncbi:MAG TPA: tetratricopeptide repeat protein [Pirellulales bacterium]|nr:tetratricopeptide repeat protein [Pirellulales bacterium]